MPVVGVRDLIVSQLNRCTYAIKSSFFFFFTFSLSLSDNGIRCFSNLDLYLTMLIFFATGKENYDETTLKGGGRNG